MSTKAKLLAMTEDLDVSLDHVSPQSSDERVARVHPTRPDASGQAPQFPPIGPRAGAKTGPGQMLQFRGQLLAAEGEMDQLRAKLGEHENSAPTKRLDCSRVLPSRWANRHPSSFGTADFARLKQDIELAGGNVQAIAVRPLADRQGYYEILFGHRRHRACAELGLPVLATIDTTAVSDLDLFSAMDRENRERTDLSAYEQGTMYRRALDEKLYPSNRRLAEALGVSHTWVANVLQVADLPSPVIECFRSPLEVQHRHAKAIAAAVEVDRKGVLRRAEKLRAYGKKLSASSVSEALVAAPARSTQPASNTLEVRGKSVGRWSRDRDGRINIQLDAGVVSEEALGSVMKSLLQAVAA